MILRKLRGMLLILRGRALIGLGQMLIRLGQVLRGRGSGPLDQRDTTNRGAASRYAAYALRTGVAWCLIYLVLARILHAEKPLVLSFFWLYWKLYIDLRRYLSLRESSSRLTNALVVLIACVGNSLLYFAAIKSFHFSVATQMTGLAVLTVGLCLLWPNYVWSLSVTEKWSKGRDNKPTGG